MANVNIKNLFLGLTLVGAASLVNAQTTQTDTVNKTATTAAVTQTGNPTIEGLKKQIEANPKDTESLAKLAAAYQEASDWTNAIETWKKYQHYCRIGLRHITARLMPISLLKMMPMQKSPMKNTLRR